MLTSIVPSAGTQPTAELMAFVGFTASGNVESVSLMKSGKIETYSTTNARSVGSGAGATVSVEAKFPFADINTFMGTNKFGPSSANVVFPLWASTHSSPASVSFATKNSKDICPDKGYLSYDSANGVSTPVGTGPVASNSSITLNTNALPGGTINYSLTVKNIGDTTGAARLLFNSLKWTLPNTSFVYQTNSTTGIVTTNPTQTATTNNMGVTTTTLTWAVSGSLAPGESTTINFRATAQNTAATNLYSQTAVVAQTPAVVYDSGNVAPVNLNAIYVTPATPINLSASNTTQTTTTLSWSASANASTYNVYDNGVLVKSGVSRTSVAITGLAVNSTHSYIVRAISMYNVESALSAPLSVTTLLPYTVTFDSQGGSSVTSTTAINNAKISAPTSPTKTGYTFSGWYKESDCTNAWIFSTDVVTANTIIYAKWTINSYTVTFETNGGSAIPQITTTYDSKITSPSEPTKTGYTFGGWFHDAALTHVYDFDNFDGDDTIIEDTTIYVKWNTDTYSVNFNSLLGSVVPNITVAYNEKIPEPTPPTKEGYTFGGWYVDSYYNHAWDFANDTVSASFTLHAKWNAISYNVTFDSQGGSLVSGVTANYNTLITEPTPPTKDGYTFGGWYKQSGCTEVWEFTNDDGDDLVISDTTLYAKWLINSHSVDFDSRGGSLVSGISANFNSTITAPTAPTRTGYTFGGWYKDASYNSQWDFANDTVSSNTILYANWYEIGYTITFHSQGGSSISGLTTTYNTTISEPTDPTRTGYTFGGWYKETDCANAWSFDNDAVTADTTIYAKWTIIHYTISINSSGNGSVTPGNSEVAYGGTQGFTIAADAGNRIKTVTFNGNDVKALLSYGVYTAANITGNGSLSVEFETIPQYTVTVNTGSHGTVAATPPLATVYEGETVEFAITPGEGYQVETLTYNGNTVTLTDGKYTTLPLEGPSTLTVTFSLRPPVPPTITTASFSQLTSLNLTVKDLSGNHVAKSIDKSFIVYDTITNPDNYELIAYGMYLKDLSTGKVIDLHVKSFVFNRQFAVHVFGDGFIFGNSYSLQGYLIYKDGSTHVTVLEQPIVFTWQ